MAAIFVAPSRKSAGVHLRYIARLEKTVPEGGEMPLLSGINCSPMFADEEFADTRKRTYMPGPVRYYALTMMFRTSEVSNPVLVHRIGREYVKRLLPDRFECVVATHVKKRTLHNHIMINALSYSAIQCSEYLTAAHYLGREACRKVLKEICAEHGIEIGSFEPNDGWVSQYWAEADGYPTLQGLMRSASDLAVSISRTPDDYFGIMKELGYSAIRRNGELYYYRLDEDRILRASRMGPEYTEEGIRERILSGREYRPDALPVQEKASDIALPFTKEDNGLAKALGTVCAAVSACGDGPGRNVSVLYGLGIMRGRKNALERVMRMVREQGLKSAEDIRAETERLRELRKNARAPSDWRKLGKENEPHDDRRELWYDIVALEYVMKRMPVIEMFAEDLEKGKFDRLEEKLREYGIGERVHGGHGDPSRE